ncbi:hypothetical protein DPMN_081228 [Dreissena polymorpha]|uniref:Uncharacterized protein n=1 Tax=Dreissena polymorpha TaxID=45954 RepID=A0A9D4BHJ8_DREPO|nr:hypothetical protein DPMN_081228 [Dreissena polymorpha]
MATNVHNGMAFAQLPALPKGSEAFRTAMLQIKLEQQGDTSGESSESDSQHRSRNNSVSRCKASSNSSRWRNLAGHSLRPTIMSIMTLNKLRRSKHDF